MSADDTSDDERTAIRPRTVAAGVFDKTLAATVPPPETTLPAGRPKAFDADSGNGLPVGTYLGEFEITATVGEGGFGIVYLATDHSLQRRVALKEYMPSALAARVAPISVQVKSDRYRETFEAGRRSFVNEARMLAQFDHPSLVKVYRFWEANGTAYMVMPFYEGKTLKDTLREMAQPPDEAWLRQLLAPLTEALAVIHAEQCYHRDIAPDNVMMLAAGQRPLLLDFGAARRVIGDMTQALTVILKPGFAPIEQYAEIPGMKQGPWTDVYALAAVVYYAIVGKTPPPSVGRLLNDTYVPLAQAAAGKYSAGFLAAIDRALAVRPETRTQTIAQLRDELDLASVPIAHPYASRPLPPGEVPPRPAPQPAAVPAPAPVPTAARPLATPVAPARSPLPGIAAGLAVLGLLGLGAYFWLGRTLPPAPAVVAAPAPMPVPAVTTPAPTPAPVPAAPATLDPLREFERVLQAQTPGFDVQAQAAKPAFRIGRDEIAFSASAGRDGYLYVFIVSPDGELVQMVPNEKSPAVRLAKGRPYRFPTADRVVLTATDPPGPAQLLVMVSSQPRSFDALQPQKLDEMRRFPTGRDAAAVVAAHTGPLPLLAGRTVCPASGPCEDDYGAAVLRFETVK